MPVFSPALEDDQRDAGYEPAREPGGAVFTVPEDAPDSVKCQFVDELINESRRFMQPLHAVWRRRYAMYRNRATAVTYKTDRGESVTVQVPPAWMNYIGNTVEQVKSWLTDNRPKFNYEPENPTDAEYTAVLRQVCEYEATQMGFYRALPQLVRDGLLFSVGWGKHYYDPGSDRLRFEVVNPFSIRPDPFGGQNLDEHVYFGEESPWLLSRIRANWPEKGHLVKPDERLSADRTDDGRAARARARTWLVQLWFRDDTMIEEPLIGPDRQPVTDEEGRPLVRRRMKYPHGRLIIKAGDVILEDKPNPFSHGMLPYIAFFDYKDSLELFSKSEAEDLELLQIRGNDLREQFWLNVRLTNNRQRLISENLWPKRHLLNQNRPGMLIPVKDVNNDLRWDDPPPMPSDALALITKTDKDSEQTTGVAEMTQGRRPTGITSGRALETVAEYGQVRVRDKARNLEEAIERFAAQLEANVRQFLSEERVIQITDDTGAPQVLRIVGELPEGAPEEMRHQYDLILSEIRGKFNTRIVAGSTLPVSKEQRARDALGLFQTINPETKMPVIDIRSLLQHIDWPDAERLIAWHEQLKAAQMGPPPLPADAVPQPDMAPGPEPTPPPGAPMPPDMRGVPPLP